MEQQDEQKYQKRLFITTVEAILLYRSETWTLTKQLKKEIDGTYTRMLRMVFNISWKPKYTNQMLYQKLPPVTIKIKMRKMRLAGQCMRHDDEIANPLVLWILSDGKASRGRKRLTYVDRGIWC